MCYAHLTRRQRYQIQELIQTGTAIGLIARKLNKHRSTVYRELRRGAHSWHGYCAPHAQLAAERRARRSAANHPTKPAGLWERVARLLQRDWAPEQIRGRALRLGQPAVSVPAIYAWIRRAARHLVRHLRYAWRRDRRLNDARSWQARSAQRPSIHQRPAEVLERSVRGHWEGDTMRGSKCTNHQLLTLVERRSRYLVLGCLSQRLPASQAVTQRVVQSLAPLPALSITFDNGSEFADYPNIVQRLRCPVFFADAHSPNQRATCENTIGLVRQYIPKGADMSRVSSHHAQRIAQRMNHRPRKCLDYLTPYEVLFNKPPVALRT